MGHAGGHLGQGLDRRTAFGGRKTDDGGRRRLLSSVLWLLASVFTLGELLGPVLLAFLGEGQSENGAGQGGRHLELLREESHVARMVQLEREDPDDLPIG